MSKLNTIPPTRVSLHPIQLEFLNFLLRNSDRLLNSIELFTVNEGINNGSYRKNGPYSDRLNDLRKRYMILYDESLSFEAVSGTINQMK